MPVPAAIVCEICTAKAAEAGILAAIATTCARELGQPLAVKTLASPPRQQLREPLLTLHLPAELAATQHEVWCLACRLACFCPSARVSVFVSGGDAFAAQKPADGRRRKSA